MLRIAIDFDETLFPTIERVVEIYNQKNNEQIKLFLENIGNVAIF